jgi:hypothetical protein
MVTDSNGKVLRRASAAALALLLLNLHPIAIDAEEEKPSPEGPPAGGKAAEKAPSEKVARAEKKKGAADLPWLPLEKGLAAVREKYSALIILHEGPSMRLSGEEVADAAPSGFLDEHVSDVSTRDAMKKFVLVRLDPADLAKPYPDPKKAAKEPGAKADAKGDVASSEVKVKKKLEIEEGKPSLLILSFREEVVRRYDGELPTRSKLRRDLAGIWKVNEVHAREARRVEPQMETSRYAFRLGKPREAVQKMLPFDEKGSRKLMDAVLDKQVEDLIAEYRARAREALEEADRLDSSSKYEAAIKAFDGAARDFPFPEVIKTANKRKSEILRKLTFR